MEQSDHGQAEDALPEPGTELQGKAVIDTLVMCQQPRGKNTHPFDHGDRYSVHMSAVL
jgi:hypothetical protein